MFVYPTVNHSISEKDLKSHECFFCLIQMNVSEWIRASSLVRDISNPLCNDAVVSSCELRVKDEHRLDKESVNYSANHEAVYSVSTTNYLVITLEIIGALALRGEFRFYTGFIRKG